MRRLLFILLAAGMFTASAQKLSPALETLLLHQQDRKLAPASNGAEEPRAEVFLSFASEATLDSIRALGGEVRSQLTTGLATASLPLSAVRAIGALDGVTAVELGADVHLCMDQVRKDSGIDLIHQATFLSQAYKGTGVVIGFVDLGLEYDHVAFREADGLGMRLKRVWDQDATGRAPEPWGYGAEYTTEAEMRAARFDDRDNYHATHTMNIAAGSDYGSNYYGVAPEAELVFVSFANNTTGVANGVQYILDYAESVGKPCVINMSLGAHQGPHDGTSSLDRFFDAVSGPGRLLVGSVGNEGGNDMHVSKELTAGDTTLKTMLAYDTTMKQTRMDADIWSEADKNITVYVGVADALRGRVVKQSAAVTPDSPKVSGYFYPEECGADFYYSAVCARHESGRTEVYISFHLEDCNNDRKPCIIVEGDEGQTVHIWNVGASSFTDASRPGWTAGTDAGSCGEIGGTSRSVLSVGSYNSRNTLMIYTDPDNLYKLTDEPLGETSHFSSRGPTADGRLKPELLAGGMFVISAFNRSAMDPANAVQKTVDANNQSYYYTMDAGTSMAAPVVTGTVALLLQVNPELTHDDLVKIFAYSGNTAGLTETEFPNNSSGYGKLAAWKAIRYVISNSGITLPEAPEAAAPRAWVEPGSHAITVTGSDLVCIYSTSGALMQRIATSGPLTDIDASGWPSGVYLVHFGGAAVTLKVAL